jgi:hypothetical protein
MKVALLERHWQEQEAEFSLGPLYPDSLYIYLFVLYFDAVSIVER